MDLGETILSAFLQALFEQILSPGMIIRPFLKLFGGGNIPKTVKRCKDQLMVMEALLRDAEQKQFHMDLVRHWQSELQDIAFDLEDILDELATEALLYDLNNIHQDDAYQLNAHLPSGFLASSPTQMMVNIFGSSARESLSILFNPIPEIESRLDDTTERLQDIQNLALSFGLSAVHGLQQQTHHTITSQRWRESSSLISERVVYGRDDKIKEIISLLLEENPSYENYVVIPIVGPGGIGKTTLVQCVYNDQQVVDHFDLKAWVCISDVFDVTSITSAIINSAIHGTVTLSNLNQAQEKLKQLLKDQKFLIILDDIWSENYADWNQLRTPFWCGAKGSRVVMTSRIEKTARMMMTRNPVDSIIINIEGLSDYDCWHLFQRHVNECSDFDEMRDDIVLNCKGLPLAVKALAGLLKSTVKKSQCREILDNIIWSEESILLPSLRLSYHHLPPHLKHLFAYCSVLPKGYPFKEMEVVLLWMAQGFIPENRRERMEDIGHNYLLDLVSRSLIEQCPSLGGRFIMHDLIHDLAKWAAGDLCCTMDSKCSQRDLKRTRHILITTNGTDETSDNSQPLPSHLRTLLFHKSDSMNFEILDNIQRFQYVRTLSLASRKIEELPECIGALKHLRFLTLKLSEVKVLPKSIGKLYNLQTLHLGGCENLVDVPDIRFLVKLRHIYIDGTSLHRMPLGIGRLISLQTVDKFFLAAECGSLVRELRNLDHLHGKVKICGLEHVARVEDAEEAQLHKKYGLDRLYLKWGTNHRHQLDDNTEKDVLEKLKPHSCIKACILIGYRGLAFPAWLGDCSYINMVEINLVNCDKCESLPPLGQLPLLNKLLVQGMDQIKQVGSEFYGSIDGAIPFRALRDLKFKSMKSWKIWLHHSPAGNHSNNSRSRAFPSLERLSITNCLILQSDVHPHFPCLKVLEIKGCKELRVSLPSLPLLEKLSIEECKVLSTTADVISCSKIMILANVAEIVGLPWHCSYLGEKLLIDNCQSLIKIEKTPLKVRRVEIRNCRQLHAVAFEKSSSCLQQVSIINCASLITIDQIPLTVRLLEIHNCGKLQSVKFRESSSSSSCLERVSVRYCSVVTIGELPLTLQSLKIEGCNKLQCIEFKEFPCSQRELARLTYMRIEGCSSLLSLQEGLLFSGIEKFRFYNCKNMESLPFSRESLPKNLTSLFIEEVNITKPIQEWGLHLLNSLQLLKLLNVGSSANSAECIGCPDFCA